MKLTLENPITIEGTSKEIAELLQFLSTFNVFDNLEQLRAEINDLERDTNA